MPKEGAEEKQTLIQGKLYGLSGRYTPFLVYPAILIQPTW
jgi:hypothetical protein